MIYRVEAVRTGGWWALSSPDVPGAHSQAKRLDQAEAMARESIALVLDLDEARVDVEVAPVLEAELAHRVQQMGVDRANAEAAVEHAATTTRSTVMALLDAGLPMRDVGRIVGVSHQRVHQLAHADRRRRDAAEAPDEGPAGPAATSSVGRRSGR